jgi:hypothetical protein
LNNSIHNFDPAPNRARDAAISNLQMRDKFSPNAYHDAGCDTLGRPVNSKLATVPQVAKTDDPSPLFLQMLSVGTADAYTPK